MRQILGGRRSRAKFIASDDLHPRANIQKMAAGIPLNDHDRAPWLERLNDATYSLLHKSEADLIVCLALQRRYRDRLRRGNPGFRFLFLNGTFEQVVANARVARKELRA